MRGQKRYIFPGFQIWLNFCGIITLYSVGNEQIGLGIMPISEFSYAKSGCEALLLQKIIPPPLSYQRWLY
jgi:hypothetical protein